jgi:hypothetical protein
MQRAVLSASLLLAASSVFAAPAPFAKRERRTDLERIQGKWEIVSYEKCYWMKEFDDTDRFTWSQFKWEKAVVNVAGDRLRWSALGSGLGEKIIHAEKGRIDLHDVTSRTTSLGIYKLEDDVLTIRQARSWELRRPMSFEGDFDGDVIFVLRRKR